MAENNVPSYATAFFYRLSADLSPHLLHQGWRTVQVRLDTEIIYYYLMVL
jgi:hypothetical protein